MATLNSVELMRFSHGFSRGMITRACAVALLGSSLGCSASDLLNNPDLPVNVSDPGIVRTAQGAVGLYNTAVRSMAVAMGTGGNSKSSNYVTVTGLLSDELWTPDSANFPTSSLQAVDSRTLIENDRSPSGKTRMGDAQTLYSNLQRVRGNTNEAIGALAKYAPDSSPALRGHVYALQGMADILLAETFCSGIPLSTLDFETGYTIKAGSSSDDVYAAAVSLFDSAAKYTSDSVRFAMLAKVGLGRAWLDLGDYDKAKAAVSDVPTDYQYQLSYAGDGTTTNFFVTDWSQYTVSIANNDGGNGLSYVSDNDPRSQSFMLTPFGRSGGRLDRWFPAKYTIGTEFSDGSAPIVLASGVEARLIEAEADVKHGTTTWLTTLNALRTDGTFTVDGTDTLWNAGTGGVAGLRPLQDPGTDTARVTMLFTERAYWLFLTGHRQGDLRRLVRQYHRQQQDVYPTGFWSPTAPFGDNTNLPLPVQERIDNPLYTGCINRDA